jgi:hypothetical protein
MLDPATIVSAGSLISRFESMLGIGAGRREADQIVPYQNEIHYNVLAPISAALDDPGGMTWEELTSGLKILTDTETAWLTWLHNTNWSDGRAAVQAEATLAPLFTEFKNEIRARLAVTPEPWFPDPVIIPGVLPTNPPNVIPDPVYTTAPPPTQTASALPSWLLPVVAIGAVVLLSRQPSRRY